MLSQEEIKHKQELNYITPILRAIGKTAEDCTCSDRPDIRLSFEDGSIIGIEVTQYGNGSLDKAHNAFYNILSEYGKRIDTQSSERYHVDVLPYDLKVGPHIQYKKVKEQIFKELDYLRLGTTPYLYGFKYICHANFRVVDFLNESFISLLEVTEYDDIDKELLIKRIKEKNRKLKDYKEDPKNVDIKEYWLVIFADTKEGVDVQKVVLDFDIESDYSRIYLCEFSNCIRII